VKLSFNGTVVRSNSVAVLIPASLASLYTDLRVLLLFLFCYFYIYSKLSCFVHLCMVVKHAGPCDTVAFFSVYSR
jgi:hypothetical protein